jgi:hypothetical protein
MRQVGAMYEVNAIIWPAVYGYTGWLWGAAYGWPVAGAIAAVVLGFAVGALMMMINPYGVTLFVPWFFIILPWFLEAETWRWTALALCAAPLPVIAAGLILKKTWV